MVFYYTLVDPSYTVYVGRDKYENEILLKYARDEDVWFHVDKLSSAHVYLRLAPGQTLDDVAEDVLADCCQLVKHNSIEGNKQSNVPVIYTFYTNLKKSGDMDVGQVSIIDTKKVRRVVVSKRINEVVNRLNKTKVEKNDVNWEQEKEDYLREKVLKEKALIKERHRLEKEAIEQAKRDKEERSYEKFFQGNEMESNKDKVRNYTEYEDDFM